MASSEPPPPLSFGEESAASQDETDETDETDIMKVEETEAAVMSLLASEADYDDPLDEGQSMLTVSEPYSDTGDSEDFPVKETSSRTSPQDGEARLHAAAGEATVKLTTEGISSLVSYSSSSAEASASEDNVQDEPENSYLDGVAAHRKTTVQYVEAVKSGPETAAEEVQEEAFHVSPGEVLAAAADALADTADMEQLHVEEAAAADSMAEAFVKATLDMGLDSDLVTMDVDEPGIPEITDDDQEEKAEVQSSVLTEESTPTPATPAEEEQGSDEGAAQETKGELESSLKLVEEAVQEKLVAAVDEKTQAVDEKIDEVDFKKGDFAEAQSTLKIVKDSSKPKSPQGTEQETITEKVQTSVHDKNLLDTKKHTAEAVVKPTTDTATKIDSSQPKKHTAEAVVKPQTDAATKIDSSRPKKHTAEAVVKPQTDAATKIDSSQPKKHTTEAVVKPQTDAATKIDPSQPKKHTAEAVVKPQTDTATKVDSSQPKKHTTEAVVKPQTDTATKIDSSLPAKPSTSNIDMDATEEVQKSDEKDTNKGKGIKRSLEEATEEGKTSHKKDTRKGKDITRCLEEGKEEGKMSHEKDTHKGKGIKKSLEEGTEEGKKSHTNKGKDIKRCLEEATEEGKKSHKKDTHKGKDIKRCLALGTEEGKKSHTHKGKDIKRCLEEATEEGKKSHEKGSSKGKDIKRCLEEATEGQKSHEKDMHKGKGIKRCLEEATEEGKKSHTHKGKDIKRCLELGKEEGQKAHEKDTNKGKGVKRCLEEGTEAGKKSHEKDTNKGKDIKRMLEEGTEEAVASQDVPEGKEKKPKQSKPGQSTASPPPEGEREEQEEERNTQEEEAEAMETEGMQDGDPESSKAQEGYERADSSKGDDGSPEGEGDDGDDKDDDKDKDDGKDDDDPNTPRRRKKKKRYYERPRGEGGKFMKEKPDPSMMDEETRMEYSLMQDEDSQGSACKKEVRRFRCEVIVPESTEVFTAEKVVEYVWPLEGVGEHYFIQEQISQYLVIMSFKRRYPDLRRRTIDMQERDYLKEKGLVSDMACDLGLTAVRSEDVLDVMFNDFPAKFEELQRLLRERKENEMRERGKVNYSMANIDKSKMQEYGRKAAADAARWNANFNKEKREDRRYSFDLQTFTLQMPIGRGKKLPPELTKIGFYPVAVLPGQYTSHYREFSPQALKTMPLGTVLAAPENPDQLGSDGGGSDSEEEPQTTQKPVPAEEIVVKEEKGAEAVPRCKVCSGTKNRNKGGKPEPLIICGSCKSASHPTCIDLTLVMVPKIESYNWQCMDCKTCVTCNDPDDEDKMIFCDMCDRGYHIYCVGLRRVPNGRWHCKECAMCSSCGSKSPAGSEHLKNAEWQHEFKKDKDNKQLRYATTLCVPCDKYWKRRQFCYVCLRVYRSIPEDGMVRCSNCPKYIHREGTCSTMYENERFCINCFKMRNSTALNHSRIIAAAKKKMASGY